MRAVERTPKPKVLKESGKDWLKSLLAIQRQLDELNPITNTTKQQLKELKKELKKAQDKYSHKKIKAALVDMFHGKCAYCESNIIAVAYGHIEHFHPKGNPCYAHLTFDWYNLLLACEICNGSKHKGTKFPIDDNGYPLLIDPTMKKIDIGQHLSFIWDNRTEIAIVQGLDAKGIETIDVFDLNGLKGRKELVRARNSYIKKLLVVANFAAQGDQQASDLIHEAYSLDEPYLGFVRQIIPTIYSEE